MRFEAGSHIGDYEVVSQLGAGGMGRVYKVRNELSDRLEAMKVLLPDLEGQADLANRFLREIKLQANLDHPNIAKLYTASRIDNQLLMFMELVEGMTIDERLRQGPIAIGDAIDYVSQVLSALDYAHQRGVVHRDIKPANMMLLPDGKLKLLDFGIARASADTRLTMTGTTLGSLYYMSPEQIQGSNVDMRSDLYSVGVSLYEMVTGKKPFDGESQFAIMNAHLARAPVPPIEVNASLPPAVSEVILMALSKDPAGRFQSAGAFRNALQGIQGGLAAAQPMTVPAPAPAISPAPPPPPTAPTVAMPQPAAATPPPLRDSVAAVTAVPATPPPPPPAAAAAPQSFHLIEPTATAAKKPGPKRVVWVAAGGLCAALAIIAFIQFGPRMKSSAKETPLQQPNTGGISTGSTGAKSSPDLSLPPQNQPLPPLASPNEPLTRTAAPPPGAPGRPAIPPATGKKPKSESAQVQAPPAAPPEQPPPPPRTQPQAPAQTQPAEPQAPQAQPGIAGMANQGRLEFSQLRQQLDMLYARAGAIRELLSQLQSAQAQQGVGLRSDWVESFNLANTALKRATEAVNAGDADGAREAMQRAARQLALLEKALGR